MVFTTRFSGGKGGRNGLETDLRRLGITQKNGKPNHPQTQGKAGRFQQTLKKWLRAQPAQPADLRRLQHLPGTFTSICNPHRPTRPLPHRATPATACAARPEAAPGDRTADTHDRVRTDTRRRKRQAHPARPRPPAPHRRRPDPRRTPALMLIHDLHIRVINAATGELLRELTLDPTRDYQPTGAPKGPKTKHRDP